MTSLSNENTRSQAMHEQHPVYLMDSKPEQIQVEAEEV